MLQYVKQLASIIKAPLLVLRNFVGQKLLLICWLFFQSFLVLIQILDKTNLRCGGVIMSPSRVWKGRQCTWAKNVERGEDRNN